MNIQTLLEKSAHDHHHLCPRQIIGVRMGLLGLQALGYPEPPDKKFIIAISETDGCFIDGLTAATGCSVGHRTMRIEDYGKVAATFVDVVTGKSVRIAPALDVRQKAYAYAPGESRRYFAQMQAYQVMPDEEMFTVTPVLLNLPLGHIISRPGVRINCDQCGEEIMNEREIHTDGMTLCQACAHGGYYQLAQIPSVLVPQAKTIIENMP
jgi:formylmethanofuran dehydrogenase subunit E